MFGYTVPTAMFQSINAFAVMLCGVFLAWVVKESVAGNRTVRIWGKFALGLGLMSAGFCILTLSARWSAMYGHSSLPLMVLGGGDGLCGTVYRSGCYVADYAH